MECKKFVYGSWDGRNGFVSVVCTPSFRIEIQFYDLHFNNKIIFNCEMMRDARRYSIITHTHIAFQTYFMKRFQIFHRKRHLPEIISLVK